MFIRLKEGFEIMEHGVQAGYWDPDKRKAVQVARVFPDKPENVDDKEGTLVIEQHPCFEEVKAGAPKAETAAKKKAPKAKKKGPSK